MRLANIRNGIRRLAFKNQRDKPLFPMAVVLVDVQVLTMEDIMEQERKAREEVEVISSCFELFIEMPPCPDGHIRRTTLQPQCKTVHGNQKEKCG